MELLGPPLIDGYTDAGQQVNFVSPSAFPNPKDAQKAMASLTYVTGIEHVVFQPGHESRIVVVTDPPGSNGTDTQDSSITSPSSASPTTS